MTADQLAEATGRTAASVTGLIDQLERSACASRERDPATAVAW
jgi:DNA-binding MarR family transcriptional regulator